jgi:Ni/Co efflux regulator RcnB
MIKTVSAALLAVSVLAAPAMAGTARSASHTAPAAKSAQVKSNVLNANAKMGHHHRHGYHHRHHGHHRHHR